jgi:hypothetical protein
MQSTSVHPGSDRGLIVVGSPGNLYVGSRQVWQAFLAATGSIRFIAHSASWPLAPDLIAAMREPTKMLAPAPGIQNKLMFYKVKSHRISLGRGMSPPPLFPCYLCNTGLENSGPACGIAAS